MKIFDVGKIRHPEVAVNIVGQLEALGLNGRQAKIYLALLQLGSASAIEIAKATGFKHPTVYDVLDVLKARRLVSESMSEGRKLFVAEDPRALKLAEDERQRTIDALLPDLQALYRGGSRRPRIRIFEGPDSAALVDEQLLNVKSKEYFYFGSVREMFQWQPREKQEEYYRKRLARGIWSYAIRVRGPEDTFDYMQGGDQHLRKVRYLPRPITEDVAGLYLFDGQIAVLSALKENYALIIQSHELFTLLKTIWQCIWEIAIPPEEVKGSCLEKGPEL